MRLIVAAIGRLKKGPEQDLVSRYADRLKKSGKAVGISTVEAIEIVESRAPDSATRKREEAQALLARLPPDTPLLLFDERGKSPSSRKFASSLEQHLENGTRSLAFVIGGPDGLDPGLRDQANQIISFGALTMPHQLVRILAFEQIYRSVTILTNHPYHRD